MDYSKRINLTLKGLFGFSLLRVPLRMYGFCQNTGIVLNTETAHTAHNQMSVLSNLDDVITLDTWNTRVKPPRNYEAGILHYQPTRREDIIWKYMHQKDFLPLLIVSGIPPTFIRENYYIFPLEIWDIDVDKFISEYQNFKKFVISNIDYLVKEIQLFHTDAFFNASEVSSNFIPLYRLFMVVGKIWNLYERDFGINEQTRLLHYNEYRVHFTHLINGIDCFENDYEISSVIRKVVISFVESHFIDVIDIAEINGHILQKIKEKRAILHDLEYYYVPESLLKEICNPLLNSISFLQLKYQLHKEELLVCNDTQQKNFTVKKLFYNNETNETIRMRFLKFPKSFLETDEGLPLDMIINTKPKNNIVKIFKPNGGKILCTSK